MLSHKMNYLLCFFIIIETCKGSSFHHVLVVNIYGTVLVHALTSFQNSYKVIKNVTKYTMMHQKKNYCHNHLIIVHLIHYLQTTNQIVK